MKVYLASIGCRLNQSEIETIARQLAANGHYIVDDVRSADQVVINTCAVTNEAAKDGRKMTRRLHRLNSQAEINLTGCYATLAPGELTQINGTSRIIANRDKERLVQILDPEAKLNSPLYEYEPLLRDGHGNGIGHTRAFVKVQDGCNNRCTFCVTTLARGQGRSRRTRDILAEIQLLAKAGYKEAVLTGVHLGSYGKDMDGQESDLPNVHALDLGDLVKAILHYTDIPRLRLSSLEPWDISPGFFELWADPRLMPHLHVPLQSGSDGILRRMARRTTREDFRELAASARRNIPDLNLSTDLIAGFPGETEKAFQDSLRFVREIGFSRLHVFSYSRRPGTAAAEMDGQVPKSIIKERVGRMIGLGRKLSMEFHQAHEDQIVDVLWEKTTGADNGGLRWIGYSNNYIRISASGPTDLVNRVTATRLFNAAPDGMRGIIIK